MRFFFCILASAICWLGITVSHAATIEASKSPNCRVAIRGQLKAGDFERFVKISRPIFPGDDGESTSRDTVCLDSSGGNLTEAVRIARHFYENGVGTVIEAGKRCMSSCAIVFMMGTATGAEVRFANRKLSPLGRLGFHRPYITSEEGTSPETLAASYDKALQSALDLIAVANSPAPWSSSPMIKTDLLREMLSHTGDDFFYIDTVDKAGRWEVDILGVELPNMLTAETAFYACENSLKWPVGTQSEDITYSKKSKEFSDAFQLVERIEQKDDGVAFRVHGLASGYVEAGCIVSTDEDAVVVCGIDENTMTIVGTGSCTEKDYRDRSFWVGRLALLNPGTRLSTLSPTQP